MDIPTENAEGRRRRVGHHIDEKNVDVRGFDFRQGVVGRLRPIEDSEGGHVDPIRFDQAPHMGQLAVHLFQESRKLWPINVVADPEEPGAGSQGRIRGMRSWEGTADTADGLNEANAVPFA